MAAWSDRNSQGENALSKDTQNINCPHCRSSEIKKNGFNKSTQKFKCKSCNKEFRQSTNTCAYHCKKGDRIRKYLECLIEGMTITQTSNEMNVSRHLAFQWRHKLLEAFNSVQSNHINLDATLEIGELKFSIKGHSKRKNSDIRVAVKNPVKVSIITTREGDFTVNVCNVGKTKPIILRKLLSSKAESCNSITAYRSPQVSRAISKLGIRHKKVTRGKFFIEHELINEDEIKLWLAKFKGVATKYLQHYLNWFAFLHCNKSPLDILRDIIIQNIKGIDIYTSYVKHRDKHAYNGI